MTPADAARGALEGLGGPTDDDRVGFVAQFVRIEEYGCAECGAPRTRAIVVDADEAPRFVLDPAAGRRPMRLTELVVELTQKHPRDMSWAPASGVEA